MSELIDGALSVGVALLAVTVLLITVRKALTARLYIAEFETDGEKKNSGIPRILLGELELLRREGGGTSLRFMTAPDQAIDVPSPIASLPGFDKVVQFVQLIPRRVHQVNGFLHSTSPRGAALTLSVSRSDVADSATTLYVDDFQRKAAPDGPEGSAPPPASSDASSTGENPDSVWAHHRLAVAGAAWLAFHLPGREQQPGSRPLLTDSWESYAQFRMGVDYQMAEDWPSARRAYAISLSQDPTNRGSLLNLAGLDINTRCNGPAIERLLLLCRLFPDADYPLDRLWYRARLNLAVACLNEDDPIPGRPECASQFSGEARHEFAASALYEVTRRSRNVLAMYQRAGQRAVRRSASPELIHFLRTVRDSAVVVQADLARRG